MSKKETPKTVDVALFNKSRPDVWKVTGSLRVSWFLIIYRPVLKVKAVGLPVADANI